MSIVSWKLTDSFPWASISGESPRFTSHTIKGARIWPAHGKKNPRSALAWQRTFQVRISADEEEVAGGGVVSIGNPSVSLVSRERKPKAYAQSSDRCYVLKRFCSLRRTMGCTGRTFLSRCDQRARCPLAPQPKWPFCKGFRPSPARCARRVRSIFRRDVRSRDRYDKRGSPQ